MVAAALSLKPSLARSTAAKSTARPARVQAVRVQAVKQEQKVRGGWQRPC